MGHCWDDAPPFGYLSEWRKQFLPTFHLGSLGRDFLGKDCPRGGLREAQTRGWQRYGNLCEPHFLSISMGTALAIPQHSKISPKGLLNSLLVGASGMLFKRFFARNSGMILVPTVGLCRAFMFVPLNEQGMVIEGDRI